MQTKEILEFFFCNFWHWLGAFMMLCVVTAGFVVLANFRLVSVIHKTKNVIVRKVDENKKE
jgi:hypothetical protein